MAVVISLLCVALAGAVFFSRRYAWWRRAVPYRHPRILMYHMVSEPRSGAKFNKLRVPPRSFEEQLRWLRDEGWHFALMSDLFADAPLPEKTVVLTFDDGYADNLVYADPIMQRYGARATLYLVEDRFDRDWSTSKKAHHDSGELMREEKLSDAQVEQLLVSGRWELGGHTRTHINLARADEVLRGEEIGGARQRLAERFGQAMDSFAYPFGIYAQADVAAARAAGFRSAVTTVEGISRDLERDALELPRVKVSGKDSLAVFRLRLRTGRRSA
ncbi:MAG: polysaccharide deacetylase family protein [Pseudomonadota bacterium]